MTECTFEIDLEQMPDRFAFGITGIDDLLLDDVLMTKYYDPRTEGSDMAVGALAVAALNERVPRGFICDLGIPWTGRRWAVGYLSREDGTEDILLDDMGPGGLDPDAVHVGVYFADHLAGDEDRDYRVIMAYRRVAVVLNRIRWAPTCVAPPWIYPEDEAPEWASARR